MGKTRLALGLWLGALVASLLLFDSAAASTRDRHPEPDPSSGKTGASEGLSINWLGPGQRTAGVAPIELAPRNAETLGEFFERQGFLMSGVRDGARTVPRLNITSLPADLQQLRRAERRKKLFLRTLLPLVLMSNEELRADRGRLLSMKERRAAGRRLAPQERAWLARMAETYNTAPDDLDALLLKVDEVPVSLALGQAILESGWGTSRFAVEGNALFGEKALSGKGPYLLQRNGSNNRFRAFPDLMSSVRAYMRNLNSHPAYRTFRKKRAALRAEGVAPSGRQLLPTLDGYAELPAYLTLVRKLIRSNGLAQLDAARLEHNWFADRSLNF